MDPFVVHGLALQGAKVIPERCKEIVKNPEEGPLFSADPISERAARVSCDNADTRNPVCMGCSFLRGREISI